MLILLKSLHSSSKASNLFTYLIYNQPQNSLHSLLGLQKYEDIEATSLWKKAKVEK